VCGITFVYHLASLRLPSILLLFLLFLLAPFSPPSLPLLLLFLPPPLDRTDGGYRQVQARRQEHLDLHSQGPRVPRRVEGPHQRTPEGQIPSAGEAGEDQRRWLEKVEKGRRGERGEERRGEGVGAELCQSGTDVNSVRVTDVFDDVEGMLCGPG